MRKSRKHFKKNKSRTKKNRCVYTDETKRVMKLIDELKRNKKQKNKQKKT